MASGHVNRANRPNTRLAQQPLTEPDDRRFDADDKRQAAELIGPDRGDLRRESLNTRKATFGVAAEAGRAQTCG